MFDIESLRLGPSWRTASELFDRIAEKLGVDPDELSPADRIRFIERLQKLRPTLRRAGVELYYSNVIEFYHERLEDALIEIFHDNPAPEDIERLILSA